MVTFFDTTCVTLCIPGSCFSVCSIENWEWPGDEAISITSTCVLCASWHMRIDTIKVHHNQIKNGINLTTGFIKRMWKDKIRVTVILQTIIDIATCMNMSDYNNTVLMWYIIMGMFHDSPRIQY